MRRRKTSRLEVSIDYIPFSPSTCAASAVAGLNEERSAMDLQRAIKDRFNYASHQTRDEIRDHAFTQTRKCPCARVAIRDMTIRSQRDLLSRGSR